MDIEILLMERGESRHEFGGGHFVCRPGELAVYWAGLPHRCFETTPNGHCFLVHLPLSWLLAWNLPTAFVRQLMEGRLYTLEPEKTGAWAERMREWCQSDQESGSQGEHCILLELEALMWRLCRSCDVTTEPPRGLPERSPTVLALPHQLALFVTEHYRDRLTASQIGAVANVHPNHAMRVFSNAYGISLWAYIARLRLAHAEYLLRHSDLTILDIAIASGFRSVGRFYTIFRRELGMTPREYRLRRGQD
jgi:AraC-like DNA-binding protein